MAFRQLLELKRRLVHSDISDAARGLEGMVAADKLLKERGYSGISLGGVAEAVWNRRRKESDLEKHKDVDVLVLEGTDIEKFEEGIDWWLPREELVTYTTDYSSTISQKMKWWENANNVVLNFGVRAPVMDSGLYIPSPEWITEMRMTETLAFVSDGVEYDEEVIDKFRAKIRQKLKTQVPKYIADKFRGRISPYELELVPYERDALVGIHGRDISN